MADDLQDANDESTESSEALIAVHWREDDYYLPPAKLTAQANASDPAIGEQVTEDKFPDCFTAYADLLTWYKRWDTVLDTSDAPFWKWFTGGELNACYNCVDRHLETQANKAAMIRVPEPEGEADAAILNVATASFLIERDHLAVIDNGHFESCGHLAAKTCPWEQERRRKGGKNRVAVGLHRLPARPLAFEPSRSSFVRVRRRRR